MIDWKRVEELKDEIGPDDFSEVADMFLQEADETVSALGGGLAEQDVESQLHFLKGSALNLGLSELAAICQDGERKAAAGQAGQVDLSRVVAVYQASRAAFVSGMAQGSAA